MDDDQDVPEAPEPEVIAPLIPVSNVIVMDPMRTRDPKPPLDQNRQCSARTRSGARCRQRPIQGGTVCRMHGGSAPQVKRAANLRLLELINPAIATLAREMATAPFSADRQRAANSILDRAGVVRSSGPDGDLARALLIDRLMTLKETGQ
jgi:hypothetical protein